MQENTSNQLNENSKIMHEENLRFYTQIETINKNKWNFRAEEYNDTIEKFNTGLHKQNDHVEESANLKTYQLKLAT